MNASLPGPAAILILLACALLPGVLALRLLARSLFHDVIELLFASVSLGILAIGWTALLLAEAGAFSLPLLAGLWTAAVAVLAAAVLRGRRRAAPAAGKADRKAIAPALPHRRRGLELAALALWLAAAVWLFFRPHEFVVGGADAGVYVSLGASIAHTGGIAIHDPHLAGLAPELDAAFLRPLPASEGAPYYLLPGFYVPGEPRGLIVPQFYPLHPVWLAIGHALGGVDASLLMTPLWGILGSLAVYMTVRRLWGWKVGFLALLALSVTALQVWFARYPTAEMLSQYLLWTGAWALVSCVDRVVRTSVLIRPHGAFWAVLAGACLGQVFLARIDMLPLLLVLLVAGVWAAIERRAQVRSSAHPAAGWGVAVFVLLVVHSIIHGLFWSRPYVAMLANYFSSLLHHLPSILGALAAGTVLLAVLAIGRRRRQTGGRPPDCREAPDVDPASDSPRARLLRWTAATLIIALGIYAYFVRPALNEPAMYAYWYGGGEVPALDAQNLVRLGWYLSPIGIALGIGGAAWWVAREGSRRTAFILGAGLLFTMLYIWRIQANPHQIYAMRRYVPVVLPFFILSGAFLLHRLHNTAHRAARALAIGLTLLWLSGIVLGARGFVSQVDYRGLSSQLRDLNSRFEPGAVLIFEQSESVGVGDFIGTPLRFVYDHPVFVLRDAAHVDRASIQYAVEGWQADGRTVYVIASQDAGPLSLPAASLGLAREVLLESSQLEHAYDHRPSAVHPIAWRLTVRPVLDPRAASPSGSRTGSAATQEEP